MRWLHGALIVALGVTTGCGDDRPTDADRQRLATLEESSLFVVEIDELSIDTPLSTVLADTDSVLFNDGSLLNGASITYSFIEAPSSNDVQAVAEVYINQMIEEGWVDITARCTSTNEGSTDILISGARWIDEHRQSAGVQFLPYEPNWRIVVTATAPRSGVDGDPPDGSEPMVSCLESIEVANARKPRLSGHPRAPGSAI